MWLLTPGYHWLRDSARTYFIAEGTWTKSSPCAWKRPSMKKGCHHVMLEISVFRLKVQLQHLPVVWCGERVASHDSVLLPLKSNQLRNIWRKTNDWKTCEELKRSWQIINTYLNINVPLIVAWYWTREKPRQRAAENTSGEKKGQACPSSLQIPISGFPSGDTTNLLTLQFLSWISPNPIYWVYMFYLTSFGTR